MLELAGIFYQHHQHAPNIALYRYSLSKGGHLAFPEGCITAIITSHPTPHRERNEQMEY